MRTASEQRASFPFGARLRACRARLARHEGGFTLIELLIVLAILGIASAMFSTLFSTVVSRSSAVSDQNILQTEVRASLNKLVSDLRAATRGTATAPILTRTNNDIIFYSPDRAPTNGLLKIEYWLDGSVLKRRISRVTSYAADGNPFDPGNTGPVEVIVASIQAPAIPAQTGAPTSAWAAGQIFKYCAQNPSNMAALQQSTAPDPITWTCTDPGTSMANIKSIVVRVSASAKARGTRYTYGAVATVRWNAS